MGKLTTYFFAEKDLWHLAVEDIQFSMDEVEGVIFDESKLSIQIDEDYTDAEQVRALCERHLGNSLGREHV